MLKLVARLESGHTPSRSDPAYWENCTIPWFSLADVWQLREEHRKYVHETSEKVSELGIANSSARILPAGTVMLSRTASVGFTGIMGCDMATTQDFVNWVCGEKLAPTFLWYCLQAMTPEYDRLRFGSTHQTIYMPDVAQFKVPLPPRSTQERIANFLDEQTARIDALIAEKEELVAKLKEQQYSYASQLMTRGLNPAVQLKATSFPEVGAVPAHWDVKRLKFLGEVRSGIAKGKDLGDAETISLPYLRVANVQDGYVDLTEVLEIEVATSDVPRYLLRQGDVLMNEGGDNDKLGRGTVWQGQIDPCVHQNHVFAVRLFDASLAEWVAKFTSTDAARTYFFLRSKQSTNLASINQSNVRELPVPMPPSKERAAILAELNRFTSAAEQLREHARAHIDRLREYRSSLISAAVTGQLDIGAFQAKLPEAA